MKSQQEEKEISYNIEIPESLNQRVAEFNLKYKKRVGNKKSCGSMLLQAGMIVLKEKFEKDK